MKNLFLLLIVVTFISQAQKPSLINEIFPKNIGPSIMSGRVVDIEINPSNPAEFYVGYASGGVWHTVNNGITFSSIMDTAPTQNIGDLAVDWNTKTIVVGTGENNSSRSSYAGIGILKTTDNGKSWENLGLPDSHHIGKVQINPNNINEIVIGVTGHLYTPNKERGVYKTTDGGKTWKKTLFIDENTGIIDLITVPNNFNIQYAASWERDRKAWTFNGAGIGSAIYKSMDSGNTWNKVTGENSGFPNNNGVGRIGLAAFDKNVIYAYHDNQNRRESTEKNKTINQLSKDDFKSMSKSDFSNLKDEELDNYLKSNGFPKKYSPDKLKQLVASNKIKPIELATYIEDANSLLFDTPVKGAELYRSDDGGKNWKKTHENYIDNLVYSYGYYFGTIAVDPSNKKTVYLGGVPLIKSIDGGKTFKKIDKENVHADHQFIWVNPKNSNHLINGNDGGVNVSFDGGVNWLKCNNPPVGQFYAINVDNEKNYNVYGGLQDNGTWKGPNTYKVSKAWHQRGKYPYEFLFGGDGMQVQIDNRNKNIIYVGFQYGNYFRKNLATGETKAIQPKHELGESPYRFNWQSPILLSKHNQDIIYYGGNKLHRSLDQGNSWKAISGDLTKGGKKGNVPYGTLTTISESPFQFGFIYIGTDDGNIQRTLNGGSNWIELSKNLPQNLWVSRVIASQHKEERVYVSLNGYRNDDFKPYVYVSEDKGETWKAISSKLPESPVNVIKEDPVNGNILYLGVDNGMYVSFDRGDSWNPLNKLPKVAVHDIVIQKETNDLIIGTHGRSLYKINVSNFQQYNNSFNQNNISLLQDNLIEKYNPNWGEKQWGPWSDIIEPRIQVPFYSNQNQKIDIVITSENNKTIFKDSFNTSKGFHSYFYDLSINENFEKFNKNRENPIKKASNDCTYLPQGKYTIKLTGNGTPKSILLTIE